MEKNENRISGGIFVFLLEAFYFLRFIECGLSARANNYGMVENIHNYYVNILFFLLLWCMTPFVIERVAHYNHKSLEEMLPRYFRKGLGLSFTLLFVSVLYCFIVGVEDYMDMWMLSSPQLPILYVTVYMLQVIFLSKRMRAAFTLLILDIVLVAFVDYIGYGIGGTGLLEAIVMFVIMIASIFTAKSQKTGLRDYTRLSKGETNLFFVFFSSLGERTAACILLAAYFICPYLSIALNDWLDMDFGRTFIFLYSLFIILVFVTIIMARFFGGKRRRED